MIPANDYGGLQFSFSDHLVDYSSKGCPLSVAEPAYPGGKPLVRHPVPCQGNPSCQCGVIGKLLKHGVIEPADVLRVAGQGGPPERSLTLTEQRSYIGRYKSWVSESAACVLHADPCQFCLSPQVVPVVKAYSPRLLHLQDGISVDGNCLKGPLFIRVFICLPEPVHFGYVSLRDVAVYIVGWSLVCNYIRDYTPSYQFRMYVCGVADKSHR